MRRAGRGNEDVGGGVQEMDRRWLRGFECGYRGLGEREEGWVLWVGSVEGRHERVEREGGGKGWRGKEVSGVKEWRKGGIMEEGKEKKSE